MTARSAEGGGGATDPIARLHNQRLLGKPCRDAAEVVAWLGAVQAQDYAGAKWALAQRTRASTDADVDRACDSGAILRTHVLRPTWHFVAPADIRWLAALSAPRVRAALAYYDRKLDVDAKLRRRTNGVLEKALHGGVHLTRTELGARLAAAGIAGTAGQRLAHLMMHAELDALICSGARRGKQFTYALVAERAPHAKAFSRDEALAELSLRYFTGHGPALAVDFAWWSGLTVRDAQRGIEMVARQLVRDDVGRKTYWRAPSKTKPRLAQPVIHLLPNYDEHLIAYKDRSAAFDPSARAAVTGVRDGVFANQVVRNGRVIGSWQRTLDARAVRVDTKLRVTLDTHDRAALQAAIARYAEFLGLSVRSSRQ